MKKIFTAKAIAISFVLLFVAVGIICLITVNNTLGWKEYRNDEFGFSFRYPKNWYISRDLPTKKDVDAGNYKHGDFEGVIFFIDPRKEGPYTGCTQDMGCPEIPTPGYVEVSFYKGMPGEVQKRSESEVDNKSTKIMYGSKAGYTYVSLGFIDFYLQKENYIFEITMRSQPESRGISERLKALYFHLVGSAIVNSFMFD
jgi:hypothetical protein